MPAKALMTKVPEYGLPHQFEYDFAIGVESATQNYGTILPQIVYDEGLGVINSAKTNPRNASFVEKNTANCYPTSRVNRIYSKLTAHLTKGAIETDKIQSLRFATMQIYTSFMDGQLAEDEVSGLDLNEILELQNESTDRQTFPLYNAVKMKDGKSNAGLNMPADQDGLTTDLELEGVTFQEVQYFNTRQYRTNAAKLGTICSGLQWHTLTRNNPTKIMQFHQNDKTKYMNPYTFLGLLVYVPTNAFYTQFGQASETTDIAHIGFTFQNQFMEYNHEFNHALQ